MTTPAPANGTATNPSGRGRRAVASTGPVPAPASVLSPESIEDQSDAKRTFIASTDDEVLTLVHAFNATGYSPAVTFQADGTKVLTV